jgi:hypothetical protein
LQIQLWSVVRKYEGRSKSYLLHPNRNDCD